MAHNPLGHVDLRVNDREVAKAFYDQLLPELGFPEFHRGENFDTYSGVGEPPFKPPFKPWFGYVQDADHRPNGNRIAFAVESRAEVDRVAALLKTAGATDISGPKPMPEYDDGYYAVFFADPFGNLLEVVHTTE